jgi:hypothetical protein
VVLPVAVGPKATSAATRIIAAAVTLLMYTKTRFGMREDLDEGPPARQPQLTTRRGIRRRWQKEQ